MKIISRLGVMLMVATLLPLTAMAADFKENRVDLGIFGGYHWFAKDTELGFADDDPGARGYKNSWMLGFRPALKLNSLFAVEGELGFLPTKVRRHTDIQSRILAWRVQGLVHLLSPRMIRPFFVLGIGGTSNFPEDETIVSKDTDAVFHTGLGLKVEPSEAFGLRLDGRMLFPPRTGGVDLTLEYEVLLGIYARLGSMEEAPKAPPVDPDSDKDGIVAEADKCPNEAEDKDGFQDEDGCVDADNDGDGVADANDACPNDAASTTDGCPNKDLDNDGLMGAADKCPSEAEDVDNFQDEDGCPDNDNDGDGIADAADKCANEAEDKDSFQDEDGCVDADNDADGIADASDKCANEAESKNGYQDDDGCPDEIPAAVKAFTGKIEGITFASGSDVIDPKSYPTLDNAVKVLIEFTNINLEISGHTDDRGNKDKNKDLSKLRAEAVKKYFVDKGVDAARLTAVGYGSEKPIADNKTSAGRAANRRIEFALK